MKSLLSLECVAGTSDIVHVIMSEVEIAVIMYNWFIRCHVLMDMYMLYTPQLAQPKESGSELESESMIDLLIVHSA